MKNSDAREALGRMSTTTPGAATPSVKRGPGGERDGVRVGYMRPASPGAPSAAGGGPSAGASVTAHAAASAGRQGAMNDANPLGDEPKMGATVAMLHRALSLLRAWHARTEVVEAGGGDDGTERGRAPEAPASQGERGGIQNGG